MESDESVEAIVGLITLLAKSLGDGARDAAITKVRSDAALGEDGFTLFAAATSPGFGDEALDLAIFVDWKAWGEIEWQANRVLRSLGSQAMWSGPRSNEDTSAPRVFVELADWLGPRGLQLVFLDTGADEYLAFAVSDPDKDAAFALAAEADLAPMTLDQFRVREIS